MFIYRLTNALEKHHIPYAIVGGHAVALHGALRGTIDIDFVINWNKKNLLQSPFICFADDASIFSETENQFSLSEHNNNNNNAMQSSFFSRKIEFATPSA